MCDLLYDFYKIKSNKNIDENTIISNELKKLLNIYEPYAIIGKGTQTICIYSLSTGKLLKCSIKKHDSIINNAQTFIKHIEDLKKLNYPILLPNDIIYDDDIWLIYTQDKCDSVLSYNDVNIYFCYHILVFLKSMLINDKRISDIYFKNWGIVKGKILLFDYNEVDTFSKSHNSCFLISNLYSIFCKFSKNCNLNWKILNFSNDHINTADIIKDNFGKGRFDVNFSLLLNMLYNKSYYDVQIVVTKCINYVKKLLYSHNNIVVDKKIYDIFKSSHITEKNTLYIYQHNNVLLPLLDIMNNISITLNSAHICQSYSDIPYIKKINKPFDKVDGKWDICIYQNSFNELLQKYDIVDICNTIKKNTNNCLYFDISLNKNIKTKINNNMNILDDIDIFRYTLYKNGIEIIYIYNIDNKDRYFLRCNVM